MITVHKYEWPGNLTRVTFLMPRNAEILCAQVQRENICIWVRVADERSKEERHFQMCGTGHVAPDGKYIGTVQFEGGALIFHIFETTK